MSDSVEDTLYRELRCMKCRKFICFEYIFDGRIKYECPRCNELNVFRFKHRFAQNDTVKKVDRETNK